MPPGRPARYATTAAVLTVAVVGAAVSYTHVVAIARTSGYSVTTARMLPASVDGLILAASMALATGARPWLARTGLVLGIAATLAANAIYGAAHGSVGVLINMWPAVSFLISSELLVGMLKARPVTVPMAVPDEVTDAVPAVLQDITEAVPDVVPEIAVSVTVPAQASKARSEVMRSKRKPDPARVFAEELAAGQVPSLRAVKEKCRVGTPRAREIQADLVTMLEPVAA